MHVQNLPARPFIPQCEGSKGLVANIAFSCILNECQSPIGLLPKSALGVRGLVQEEFASCSWPVGWCSAGRLRDLAEDSARVKRCSSAFFESFLGIVFCIGESTCLLV